MNQLQQLFGEPSARSKDKVRPYMVERVQDFIRQSPFMVMASSSDNGACDASPKGGMPGFVKVLDEKHLLIPDVAGNKLFQSYENIATNPHVGLVFFIPPLDGTARVNGRVTVLRKGDELFESLSLEVFAPDENAKLQQALLLEVVEAYHHCPRALRFSKLWSTKQAKDLEDV
ncbi:pyridoxamine 5'-phosphate oxidase family protein [Congregibacter brevis]|uniref:Pyridoxamine 5'-phosphate oxidase family protein n=1 Tax=Congregibacter brevis TaxID=3081201 RepID=A0ABZ0IHK7_9GAMM|nr:pyridoxamine 5'-phosphate oxidase family protein [Congregibacter sp. IMCC45268]